MCVEQKAPEGEKAKIAPKLERLSKSAANSVTEQELRPLLERMAKLIDHKVWYITEKGDIQVSRVSGSERGVCAGQQSRRGGALSSWTGGGGGEEARLRKAAELTVLAVCVCLCGDTGVWGVCLCGERAADAQSAGGGAARDRPDEGAHRLG